MKYEKIIKAKFIERENRFVARVELPDGEIAKAHVKNTGRCRELLLPGAEVYLEDHADRMGSRKLRYSLIAVRKAVTEAVGSRDPRSILINMDSQAPNKVVGEALADGRIRLPGFTAGARQEAAMDKKGAADQLRIKSETRFGDSRFDFYVESTGQEENPAPTECPAPTDSSASKENPSSPAQSDVRKAFIEVKGVTLEDGGHARFPDAPTQRGVKHIHELIRAREEGYGAYIIFVVQMEEVTDVSPNYETHPQFGEALAKAEEAGVKILAYNCLVEPDRLEVKEPIDFICKSPAKRIN